MRVVTAALCALVCALGTADAQDTWTGWVDVDSGFGGDDVLSLDFFDG